MRVLPLGWRLAKLGAIGQLVTGSTPPARHPEYYGNSIPFFKPTDLTAGPRLSRARQGLSELGAQKARLLPGNSVLVTCIGATLGKTALCVVPAATNQQINAIVVREEVALPAWVYFWVVSSAGQRAIAEQASATTLPILNKGRMAQLQIPLPPLQEQARIVARIEALTERSRRARHALEALPPMLERLRGSVRAAAFRGELTQRWRAAHPGVEPAEDLLERVGAERRHLWEAAELKRARARTAAPRDSRSGSSYQEPDRRPAASALEMVGFASTPPGWSWTTLGFLSSLVTSGSRGWGAFYAEAGPLFIRSRDIHQDFLDLSSVARVALPAGVEGARTRLERADLLITITGANVAKAAVVNAEIEEAYISQHVALVRAVNPDLAGYLHLWLTSSSGGRRALTRWAYGGGKPGLNLKHLRDLPVLLPPLSEAKAITAKMDAFELRARHFSAALSSASARHASLDASMLRAALEGRLTTHSATRTSGGL